MRRWLVAALVAAMGCSDETSIVYVDAPDDDGAKSPVPVEPPPEPACAAKHWSYALLNDYEHDTAFDVGVSADCRVAFSGDVGEDVVIGGLAVAQGARVMLVDAEGAPAWSFGDVPRGDSVYARFDRTGALLLIHGDQHVAMDAWFDGNVLTKLDPTGNVVWQKAYKTTSALRLGSVGIDGIALAGSFDQPFVLDHEVLMVDGDRASVIALLDTDGRLLHKTMLSGEATVAKVEGDWYGNVYALVTTEGAATVGSEPLAAGQTAFIVFDPSGQARTTSWATAAFDVDDLAVDQHGRSVLAGTLADGVVIGGEALGPAGHMVVVLDAAGAHLWHSTLPGAGALAAAIDDRGHVYAATHDNVLTLHQLDDAGVVVATTSYPQGAFPIAMMAAPAGGVVLSGDSNAGTLDFGSGAMPTDTLDDLWVASLPPAP